MALNPFRYVLASHARVRLGVRVGQRLRRRMERVLLHDQQRREHLPRRLLRRRLVEGRRLGVLPGVRAVLRRLQPQARPLVQLPLQPLGLRRPARVLQRLPLRPVQHPDRAASPRWCAASSCARPLGSGTPRAARPSASRESTRSHSAACLPGKNPTRIEIKYQDMGLRGSVARPAGDPRTRDAAQRRTPALQHGLILWHRTTGAHEVHGSIADRYRGLGCRAGAAGLSQDRPARGRRRRRPLRPVRARQHLPARRHRHQDRAWSYRCALPAPRRSPGVARLPRVEHEGRQRRGQGHRVPARFDLRVG